MKNVNVINENKTEINKFKTTKVFGGLSGSRMRKPSQLGSWRRSSTVNLAYGASGGTIKSGWIPPGEGAGAASGAEAASGGDG